MLEIIHGTKIFQKGTSNEHKALCGINLSLKKGDFVTVVGSNGAGKSSLFGAICGNFYLDNGGIILNGEDITFMKEHKRARMIGRVFQDPIRGTAPHMTIEENLALAYYRSKKSPFSFAIHKQDRKMFQEQLSRFGMGLEDRMNAKIGLLSGGQRQVVTLLMCTISNPKLLLLDEHTAALDPATAQKVMESTKQIVAERNLTTMMITHQLSSAIDFGNRLIMMDAGEIILDINDDEKKHMTVDDLMKKYSEKKKKELDNDRMLLI
ncbi:MAG: ATP-binding cassette domain-containing protein [Clostridiales bacterium]|nr:ATP-binding cassette domain-containing protein [Clostridiales bacterium]